MLNTKKGPAVRALRAQADKITYKEEMIKTITSEDNLEVLQNTPVPDVLHIQVNLVRHHLLDIDLIRVRGIAEDLVLVDVLDRGIVRDARLHAQHLSLLFSVHLHILPHFWSGTHQTHVALQNVPELRQLVKFVSSDEESQTCNAFVFLSDSNQSFFI